ncbi:MAG: type IV toxin-antitoxin system AbiEi family antitoxin domain-containing protein [Candidatus Saganbacteria bacterium]|nr:type IV toxin-antitoxin system AbiEi family antitoxin domain-containing protein [Candidatus Saganbacteria bacterium]
MSEYFTSADWLLLLQKLAREKNKIFSPRALQQASGLSRRATQKAVQRLTRRGQLVKLCKNAYASKLSLPSLEEVAMFYGKPCYISFESALERHGLLSQAPLVLTCAIARKARNARTPLGEIVFHHLAPGLFNGYENDRGILWATPEKALLDHLYIKLKNGQGVPALDELDLKLLDRGKLKRLARPFPHSVRGIIRSFFAGEK